MDYEKIDRLIELRADVEARVESAEMELKAAGAGEEVEEDEVYLEKLDKGLFSLQLCDYIIGWLCMEDDGVRPLSLPPSSPADGNRNRLEITSRCSSPG